MRLGIRHETRYDYEDGASGAVLRLRLMPRASDGQTIERWFVSVNGVAVTRWIATSYGDLEAIWRADGRVEQLIVLAQGVVETHDRLGIFKASDEDVNSQAFLLETDPTMADDAIRELGQEALKPDDRLATLHALCALVHERIEYRAGVTDAGTSAAEALAIGRGVCQDQAHIFVSAARSLGIPARYVTGYLLDEEREEEGHDPHGWAEALVPGLGWIGFDCTLKLSPTDHHVRLTCGLDAQDAAPVRGVAQISGEHKVSADVQIDQSPAERASGQGQAQQQ
jgi:transglutaminase-like putative cysteine protease